MTIFKRKIQLSNVRIYLKVRGKISNAGITVGKKRDFHFNRRQKLHRVL